SRGHEQQEHVPDAPAVAALCEPRGASEPTPRTCAPRDLPASHDQSEQKERSEDRGRDPVPGVEVAVTDIREQPPNPPGPTRREPPPGPPLPAGNWSGHEPEIHHADGDE